MIKMPLNIFHPVVVELTSCMCNCLLSCMYEILKCSVVQAFSNGGVCECECVRECVCIKVRAFYVSVYLCVSLVREKFVFQPGSCWCLRHSFFVSMLKVYCFICVLLVFRIYVCLYVCVYVWLMLHQHHYRHLLSSISYCLVFMK